MTFLELLLAIAILVALGSLVLPVVGPGMRQRAFDSSADAVRGQLLLARAHAQATGRPVEVTYRGGPPRVTAAYFEMEPGDDTDARPAPITYSWAERPLPAGVRIEKEPGLIIEPPPDTARETTGTTPARLAVFTPDGSALLAGTVWIGDDHGRIGRLSVDPWTGLPAFEPGAAEPPAAELEPDEEDEPW